jgi:hypothetical protein
MKYINSCGTLCVHSSKDVKFVNFMAAVMACNAVQVFYACLGFSVNSSVCESTKRVEIRIHFDSFDMPVLPAAYLYSDREITSQRYDGYRAMPGERVRVVSYSFEF